MNIVIVNGADPASVGYAIHEKLRLAGHNVLFIDPALGHDPLNPPEWLASEAEVNNVSGVIYCSSYCPFEFVGDITAESLNKTMAENVLGLIAITQTLQPALAAAALRGENPFVFNVNNGANVNAAAELPSAARGLFNMSEGACKSAVKDMAAEYGEWGISTLSVFVRSNLERATPNEQVADYISNIIYRGRFNQFSGSSFDFRGYLP